MVGFGETVIRSEAILGNTYVKGQMASRGFGTDEIIAQNESQGAGQTRALLFLDTRQCLRVEYEVELSVQADWILGLPWIKTIVIRNSFPKKKVIVSSKSML